MPRSGYMPAGGGGSALAHSGMLALPVLVTTTTWWAAAGVARQGGRPCPDIMLSSVMTGLLFPMSLLGVGLGMAIDGRNSRWGDWVVFVRGCNLYGGEGREAYGIWVSGVG